MAATVRAHDDAYRRRPGRQPLLVVQTDPLRSLLTRFVSSWQRDHPTGREGGDVQPLSAIDYLAGESGVGASTIQHMLGPAPSPTTLLGTADAIVSAIGRPEAFYDGTLQVYFRRRGGALDPADD